MVKRFVASIVVGFAKFRGKMANQSSAALRDRILELEMRSRRIEGFLDTSLEPSYTPLFEAPQVVLKIADFIKVWLFVEGRIVLVAEDLSELQDVVDWMQ
ncbi:hypothetical protein BUALT_Bualt04G0045800 [Buddleja alternifolia]|uniref:Uncharacterized protein n=1 Tax=Buddleja alternifolia TaxID=168488 RepID=A0AAV6XXJ4_9LAMI|nr:hypothetical protein BUALT_Bualt04G0045800 [Buddleja alternifolia]